MKQQSRVLGASELRGVLFPVGSRFLLLPSVAVAEVIGYQEPEAAPGDPQWLLGRLSWRGRAVPLVSFERALGHPAQERKERRTRIAVLNTASGNPQLPYIALLSPGVSRLARISAENLEEDPEGMPLSELVAESVSISGQPAWIPDLDALERMVTTAGV
jgi:chemosensory pili system protein ChpC